MKTTLMLLAALTLATTAFGQIGWTLEQCQRAYGKYTTDDKIVYQFANAYKGEYVIDIEMRNGLVESAQYSLAMVLLA